MITSALASISSASASLNFKDAGSVALAIARQSSGSRGNDDDTSLITELLAAAAINLVPAAEEGKSSPTVIDGRLHWTLAAAINALLQRSLDDSTAKNYVKDAMEGFFLPMLDASAKLDASQTEQIVEAAVALISHADAWQYSLELLQSCFPAGVALEESSQNSVLVLEPAMIQLCSQLIDAAPGEEEKGGSDGSASASAAVLSYAADSIFPNTLSTLTSFSTKNPTPTLAAIGQSLLPSALTAAKKVGKLSSCLTILWSTCNRLGQSEIPSECRNGLSFLVQFCQPLLQYGNIAQDPALWELLLRALRSDQGLNRKRALHVLENAIAQLQEEEEEEKGGKEHKTSMGNKENIAAWGTFIRLYITVDDTSMHLFKEAWPEVDRLHSPAAAGGADSGGANSEVDVGNTSGSTLALPVAWMMLLWDRALQHRHLTAQKLAAVSFLQRIWPAEVLAQVPPSFCPEVLLPVLGLSVMQRGEHSEEIAALVPGFFQKWSASLPRKECLELLKSMLGILSGQQQQQGMMKRTAIALKAATEGISLKKKEEIISIFEAEEQAELVQGATAAAAAQPGFGANAIALKIYVSLIAMLSSCVVIDSVEMLELVTSFLAVIPVPLLQPGGLLCAPLVDWFSQKAHASILPNTLETLVNMHIDAHKKVDMNVVGKENKKGGPSAKQIAYGALILAEAVAAGNGGGGGNGREEAERCLNLVFSTWKAELSGQGKEGTAALPLLAALLTASKELPQKKETTPVSSTCSGGSCMKIWLPNVLCDICNALVKAVDETHAVWLLSVAQRESIEKVSSYIDAQCAAKNISKDEAFNNDDVLPREFVERRNAACNALACVAGAPTLLLSDFSGRNSRHLEAAEKYAACAAGFVTTCSTGYSTLLEDFSTDSVDMRVRLEAAIAILRPLAACSQSMLWPHARSDAEPAISGNDSTTTSNDTSNKVSGVENSKGMVISLVSNLLDALEISRAYKVPENADGGKNSEKNKKKSSKKKKKNWKLEPLTLHSWHNMLSWRSIEAFVANNAVKNQILPIELQGRIFASAVLGLSGAPEGSNAIILYIRCLRAMIPALVQHSETIVPSVVAAARRAAAAGSRDDGCEILPEKKNAEKQQYQELLNTFLTAGDSATLNDVVAWMGGALLFGLDIHVRKRTGMTAAVLSCCLHPCFFQPGQESLHQVQKEEEGQVEGAVRSIIEGFLSASTKHSRTFILFSTQISALLAAFPAMGPVYCDVAVELLQMGFDEEHHLQSLDDAILDEPTAAELTALLEPLDAELAKAHMASYAAPRVNLLCLLHFWVQQGLVAEQENGSGEQQKINDALIGLAAAREMWSRLFKLAITDPELNTGRYLHNGPTHRKKLRVWQALTVLCPAVPAGAAADTLMQVVEALDIPNAATVKQFQEIVALKMIQNQPDLLESCLLPRICEYTEQRNEAMPCLISIAGVSAFFAAKKHENDTILEENKKKELINRVVSVMLPWAATFVHGSRTFAQLVLWRMGEVYPWLHQQDAFYAAFYIFFSTNVDLKRLRKSMGVDFGLDKFDFERATSPKGVLCEESALLGTSNTGGPLEGVPLPLMDCLSNYLAQERMALREEIDAKMADFALQDEQRRNTTKVPATGKQGEKAIVMANGTTSDHETSKTPSTTTSTTIPSGGGDVYQRKITPSDKEAAVTDPWRAALGLAALSSSNYSSSSKSKSAAVENAQISAPTGVVVDEFEADPLRKANDEALATAQKDARQELIIVASLIDKLPNLAGLARTCEVFRASKLVLADASITKHPHFAAISVSAEHWVPIEQVTPIVLATWLRKKAAEGYTLVGLEQTAESTRLQEYKFPKKTVLLLGAEKEGVPADLLQLLDATVEIPQLGVVRSLNVHVSAAIGIYEFTRQNLAAAAAAKAGLEE